MRYTLLFVLFTLQSLCTFAAERRPIHNSYLPEKGSGLILLSYEDYDEEYEFEAGEEVLDKVEIKGPRVTFNYLYGNSDSTAVGFKTGYAWDSTIEKTYNGQNDQYPDEKFKAKGVLSPEFYFIKRFSQLNFTKDWGLSYTPKLSTASESNFQSGGHNFRLFFRLSHVLNSSEITLDLHTTYYGESKIKRDDSRGYIKREHYAESGVDLKYLFLIRENFGINLLALFYLNTDYNTNNGLFIRESNKGHTSGFSASIKGSVRERLTYEAGYFAKSRVVNSNSTKHNEIDDEYEVKKFFITLGYGW